MQYIETSRIHPHPDNPRKELGDLTELAESIKEQGILQNLTVIPDGEEDYLVVIGHRRLAAAQLAGLTEVPCVVSYMDHKTQVGTMLLENIQRQDLTAYEQAQGFQMMMDLGASIQDISRETGLSETTVRHRIRLNELDQDVLKKKCESNITMFDLIKLEQIKDPDLKNNALAKIGTKDFDYAVNEAIKEEKFKAYLDDVEEDVSIFAEKIDNSDYETMRYHTSYDKWKMGKEVFVPDDDSRKYYYVRTKTNLTVYMGKTDEEMKVREMSPEEIAEQEALEERYSELNNIVDTMYETRLQYINNVGKSVLKENIDRIMRETIKKFAESASLGNEFSNIMGIKMPDGISPWSAEYKEQKLQQIEEKTDTVGELKVLTVAVYSSYEERCGAPFYNDCVYQHSKAQHLKKMYDFLEIIGYEMSSEEKQIVDGTHELYTVLPEDEDDEV